MIADVCEIVYLGGGREKPDNVHLVCTSNTGVQQTMAIYESVECSSKNK